jgi:hypothetical protein
MRVIVTKRRIYELASDEQGVPVEEYFAGVTLPETIKGAKVYDTVDGPVVAMPGATLTAPPITGTPDAMTDKPWTTRGDTVKEIMSDGPRKTPLRPPQRRGPLLLPVSGGRVKHGPPKNISTRRPRTPKPG